MSAEATTATEPAATARPARPREPVLATILRMLVHASAGAVFAWPLTVVEGTAAAAAGAAVGALLARFVAESRLRAPTIVALGLAGLLVAWASSALVVGTDVLAPVTGPAAALRAGEALAFGNGALAVSATLRALSIRRPLLTVLEVAFVGIAFAGLVVAHRNGAIHRPFEIADPIIAEGGDPTVSLMIIGAVAAAVVVLLLLSERNAARGVLHLVAAILLLGLGLGVLGLMPEPVVSSTGGGLGLRPDEGDEENDGNRDQSSGQRSNEELEFRDNYDDAANRVPVGVVLLHDDYSPPTGVYYLRQGAFSQYNGRRLVAATRAAVDRDVARGYPTRPTPIDDPPPAGAARSMVESTVALLAEHTRPFALESPIELRPEPNPDPRRFKRMYRAQSAVLTADHASMLFARVGEPDWSRQVWDHYLEAPDDPRYQELATRIVADLPEHLRADSVARALAVSGWLSREGTYSLRSRHASATDPVGSFLFGDVTGYCVHFSHAAVYLMRTLGVPSRVATGYAIDEASRYGGSALLVTGSASHAWPEIHVEGVGWVVVDVAPETVVSQPPAPPDPELQRLLAELVRGHRPLPVDGRAPTAMRAMALSLLEMLGLGLAALSGVALVMLLLVKIWRLLVPVLAGAHARPRVVYRAELDRLAGLRIRRAFGESRESFARRVGSLVPSFAALTRAHVAAKFGAHGSAAEDPRAVAKSVRAELRKAFPWWKRALAALEPWSWLLSR